MTIQISKNLKQSIVDCCIKAIYCKIVKGQNIQCCNWDQIADYIWDEATFIAKGKSLYCFNELYYERIEPEFFRDCIKDGIMFKGLEEKYSYSTTKANEVFTQLCDHVQLPEDKELDQEEVVPFQNGYIIKGIFHPGSEDFPFHEYYITKVIPYDYDPQADCPDFKYLMEKLLPDKDDRMEVYTYLAYCMIPMRNNLRYHQAWWGGGNNGKTQLAEHFGGLLGSMTSYIALNVLLRDDHAIVGLRGKTLNVSSEVKGVVLNATALDRFKGMLTDTNLTGRDVFESQLKAQYPNTCKHIITANDLPYSEYMSDDKALFSRWKLIYFPYEWCDADWEAWKDEDGTTKHVFDKIFKTEASGILSYICSFRQYFEILTVDWKVTQRKWITAGNSAIAFVHCPGIVEDFDTEKRKLFECYADWCDRNKRKKLTYQTFFQTLKHRGYHEVRKQDDDGHYIAFMEALGYNQAKDEEKSKQTLITELLKK